MIIPWTRTRNRGSGLGMTEPQPMNSEQHESCPNDRNDQMAKFLLDLSSLDHLRIHLDPFGHLFSGSGSAIDHFQVPGSLRWVSCSPRALQHSSSPGLALNQLGFHFVFHLGAMVPCRCCHECRSGGQTKCWLIRRTHHESGAQSHDWQYTSLCRRSRLQTTAKTIVPCIIPLVSWWFV